MSTYNESHGKHVASMFARIVPKYDMLNILLSGGLDRLWRRRLLKEVRPGSTGYVLDIAAGTLDVSLAIASRYPQHTVLAMDFCPPMLVYGQKKCQKARQGAAVLPVAADAKILPLPDNSVDCITMAFGIRNVLPREEAFKEMVRVLVPGGRACILEFGSGKNKIWGGLYNTYLEKVLPHIGKMFSGDAAAYTYLADTIRAFPTAVELEEEMRMAGFVSAWHMSLTSGIVCLHVGEKARIRT